MDGHAARARLPEMALGLAQTGEFFPGFAAVNGLENGGVLDPGIGGVRFRQRRFEMPDAFEFPGMLRAIVPFVRAGFAVIDELIAFAVRHAVGAWLRTAAGRLPGFAAVIGTLDDLAEPAAGLVRVNVVRMGRRAFHVINLPA